MTQTVAQKLTRCKRWDKMAQTTLSRQAAVTTEQNKKDKESASRFWGTGESRSAGFISVRKPEFPLRFRGPGN